MPFKSKAQRRKFYAMADRGEISDATVERWEDETPKGKKLPERVKQAEPPPPKGVSCEEWDKILSGKQLPKRTKNAYLLGVQQALDTLGMTGE